MSEMEEKLGAILGNPQMMQQIMSLAQSMGQPPAQTPEPEVSEATSLDPKLLQTLSAFAGQGKMDPQQQALLKALGPYISPRRIGKLEKAMGAARMARAASGFLSAGGLELLQGR